MCGTITEWNSGNLLLPSYTLAAKFQGYFSPLWYTSQKHSCFHDYWVYLFEEALLLLLYFIYLKSI